jgi:GNAT superfamily N-acetyltransferase
MTSSEISIREAQRHDVPAMAALIVEFAAYMRELGDTSDLRLNAAALERDGFGNKPAFQGMVAEIEGAVVGFLLHHEGYDTDAACRLLFVVDLYVKTSTRSRGVGTALMNEARKVAVATGAVQLEWTVDRRNARARSFYENIGARYVDTLELMYLDAR